MQSLACDEWTYKMAFSHSIAERFLQLSTSIYTNIVYSSDDGIYVKIMLCWSGSRGKAVATALHDWLPSVIQILEPWMSDEDIEMGSRWGPELDKQLSEANFGIICLTPESLTAVYIHYEAGALSKIINESHV
jgi:hypothetical protein